MRIPIFNNLLRILLILVICVSGGFVFSALDHKPPFTAYAEEGEDEDAEDLDVIIINNDVYEKDRKGPVRFPHYRHARADKLLCWECHHEYDDGENIYRPWGMTLKCADCHDPEEKVDNVVKLQTAYHLSCKKCHEKMRIYGDEPLAYRKCNKCHEEKN